LTDAPILRVDGLETAFRADEGTAHAVRGVSFAISPGETLALVGESGSGKSVTALSIIGLLPPNGRIVGGSIALGDLELVGASKRVLRGIRGKRIAMVFQDSMTSLNPLLTVGRQITESLEVHLGLSRADAGRRAVSLLEEVGVPEPQRRLRQYPHQLSGGLRQRVAVAVALAPNPDVLIADEPTTALDVTIQAQLLELLKRERAERDMALLLITHDLGVVAGMTDRLGVMYAGRIVEEGPTDRVFETPRHPYTLGLLRSVPRIDGELERRLPSIAGAPPPIWSLPPGCAFRPRCPFAVDRCEHDDPPLEPREEPGLAVACWVDVREPAR
jgi:oligopeptide/dipeptide ABC transporter ATP-binding protein